jgi:hypothetical protein
MRHSHAPYWLVLALTAFGTACGGDDGTTLPTGPTLAAATLSAAQGATDPSEGPFTVAVIGDTPYGPVKLAEFPSLVARINADPEVQMVFHAGDIKAGKNAPCTDAYFDQIRGLFGTFADPLVYTPGDNEWTDCHVAVKNNGLYTPTERLQAVRTLFFPAPGRTLGQHGFNVESQASDPANSAYVENVIWKRARVVYATLNIPGSNNDQVSWGSPLPVDAANYPSQAEENATRAQADRDWLNAAFARAEQTQAAAVVLLFQADMWDTAEPTLSGYDALVQQIGGLAAAFGKPVLLLEGDSHAFRVDHPFTPGDALFGLHPTPVAPNVTRIVLEGSDAGRTEYLRLTVDSRGSAGTPFSWVRVPLH